MKIILLLSVICLAFIYGCETTSPITPTPTFVLVGEISGDSVGVAPGGIGTSSNSQSITSSQIDFTSADSMKIEVTIEGTTNNANTTPFQISYTVGTTTVVYTIPSSSFNTTEQNVISVIVSPKVLASFKYVLTYQNTDSNGGYAKFRDLKIYKK